MTLVVTFIICTHPDEISEQLQDVGPKFIFAMTDIIDTVDKAVKLCRQVKVINIKGGICGAYHTLYFVLCHEDILVSAAII